MKNLSINEVKEINGGGVIYSVGKAIGKAINDHVYDTTVHFGEHPRTRDIRRWGKH